MFGGFFFQFWEHHFFPLSFFHPSAPWFIEVVFEVCSIWHGMFLCAPWAQNCWGSKSPDFWEEEFRWLFIREGSCVIIPTTSCDASFFSLKKNWTVGQFKLSTLGHTHKHYGFGDSRMLFGGFHMTDREQVDQKILGQGEISRKHLLSHFPRELNLSHPQPQHTSSFRLSLSV